MHDTGKMMSIRDAVRVATGQDISAVSAWRYCTTGRHGIKLRYWMLGAKKLTTPEEVVHWMTALANHRNGLPVATKASEQKRLDVVDEKLNAIFDA